MRLFQRTRNRLGNRAFTLLELFIVLALVLILLALILPAALIRQREKSRRIRCADNIKRTYIASALSMEDSSGGRYAACLYTNETGGWKIADATNIYIYFQVMSNDLHTPDVLHCPADLRRRAAKNFTTDFNGSRISYFLGADADETMPQMFLTGDRNLTNGMPLSNGIMEITPQHPAGWTMEMHHGQGNIGLADGSVQQFSATRLTGTNRLAFP